MSINADTLAQIVDEREELQARSETLWDALTHCYAIAKKGKLNKDEADDALARVVAIIRETKDQLDDMLNAGLKRGTHYELLDEEAMDWYDAVERQFHLLSPEGKRRVVACRKRATAKTTRETAMETPKSHLRLDP